MKSKRVGTWEWVNNLENILENKEGDCKKQKVLKHKSWEGKKGLQRERERDVIRLGQTDRAVEEVWASEGVWSEGSLPQSHGNPRWREQRSKGRCSCHR